MSTGVDVYSTTPASNGTIGGTGYFPEGQAPSTVNDAARQVMADIAAWFGQAKVPEYLTGVAGTNTVTAGGPASLAAYGAGQRFILIPANTNTAATTVNITPSGGAALGAKNLFAYGIACVGGELVQNMPTLILYDGTQFHIVGHIGLTKLTNSLSGDVALNNTGNYFDGPVVAQGTAGTWFVSGSVTCQDTAGAAAYDAKLWDGTTVIASTRDQSAGANETKSIALSGYITSPAGNIRISVKDNSSTSGSIKFNLSGNSKDSTISVLRIA